MAANPLIANYLNLQRLPLPDTQVAAIPQAPVPVPRPIAAPVLPVATAPAVTKTPDPIAQATQNSIMGHQAELQRLNDTGSGISQIKNPLLRGLARVGDVAESIILPRAAAFTPGTEMNHRRLIGQEQGYIDQGLGDQQREAQTAQEQALTDYTAQRPAIEQSKIDQRQLAVRDRVAQAAAARGQLVTWDSDGVPSFSDDHESQAFKDHQALSAMHQATADKSAIMADIQKNHYIPGTPEWTEAQKKLQQVDQRLQVAMGSLGLRAQGLALRRENMNANLYGVGQDGQPVAGATQIVDDQGTPTTVGPRFANNAIKQQKTVSSFNDLSGSVNHLRDAIKAYEAEGGDMSDARLAAAASDPHSTIGKVIQGKMVTGGLSPAAINLLNAQRQTMEQAGILRSTTGGTSSEAGAQRILDVVPKFGSDTNSSAYNKLQQQEEVLRRLAPGVTSVKGGMSVQHRQQQQSGTRRFTVNGTTYNIPADQVKEFLKDFPNAK